MATSVTPGGNAKHCDGCRDPANCTIVSDQCGVCNQQFNEITGNPIICGGKQFHRCCFKCRTCRTRLTSGWIVVHPAGLFCNDECLRNICKKARGEPYRSGYDSYEAISDFCLQCSLPVDDEHPQTWFICAGNKIHQECFKCETCGNKPPPKRGSVVSCIGRFFCDDDCIRSFGEKSVKVNYQPTTPARVTNATTEDGSEQCGVCNKSINEEPISCGEKQFHRSCFKCKQCDARLRAGWILMLPDAGLFCDACLGRFDKLATQVSYKPGCNDDNNSNVNNCLVCELPVNKEHLETCINCSGSIIHQKCFKCKACDASPPPKGEIMALANWFFCNDDCIRSFAAEAVPAYNEPTAPARVADATKETEGQTRGANEGKKIDRTKAAANPAIVDEERSSRKKPSK